MSTFIERLTGEARERLICRLTRRMVQSQITIEALEHAFNRDVEDDQVIRYRDAYGNAWTGLGEMPEWLRRAVAEGESIDHFR
ncbi:H-NS family nucleoid-associated regulatory protein [Paraburkholderia kirstenboschensis]|uniref:H-NS family nucleoid-associated regulatory protein n=1 Tax=Paraburkholderia kirstenboschensis TaxID=1245436 RepID=A0ABZ0E9E7_9BURK|nr:H-NS family nucleoid-associated regulatory protein [Paraburkholderia kirstenboschensis]WOD13857.1 H-NS family nucleoid-associated regulatory protein [Paraburkholderia kirstenboschensis]